MQPPHSPRECQRATLNGSKPRLEEIDGIRGWAAFCVLLFHLMWELLGATHPSFRTHNLRALLDGPLAVYIFFVLSGDALSCGFMSHASNGPSPRIVLKRYFRLAGPIFFSCLVIYVLMRMELVYTAGAAPIAKRLDWMKPWLPFQPSIGDVLQYSLMDVFTKHSVQNSYNPFLWPMGIELGGSLLIFGLGSIYHRMRSPDVVVLVTAVYLTLLGSIYALFLYGAWFGSLREKGTFSRLHAKPSNHLTSFVVLILLFILDRRPDRYKLNNEIGRILLATAFVWCCYASKFLHAVMRAKLSRWLGKISFPVYFMQFSIIASWSSWCLIEGNRVPASIYASPAFLIVSSVLLTLTVATFTEALEQRYLQVLDYAVTKLLR